MIRQPPDDADRTEPAAPWPAGSEQPTRQLPGVPERFAPGRAQAQPPAPRPVSGAPVTSPYPPGYPEPYPDPQYAYPVVATTTNGMAIGSLICSIIGIFTCFVMSPVGALLGHLARRRIRRTGEAGDGLALAGIVIGWLGMALFAVCCGGVLILANTIGLGDFGTTP